MKFNYGGRVASLEFDSKTEFTEWVVERCNRAGSRFPGEVETVGAAGPMSILRVVADELQAAAILDGLVRKFGEDVTAVRIPLDKKFSILQVEGNDSATGIIALWNIGGTADFEAFDNRPTPVSSVPSPQAVGLFNDAKAIAGFSLAYSALGRSRRFSIDAVPPSEVKSTRKLFAGFCPRCDGLLERTGLRVEEQDNRTVLWEARCLDCDLRLLSWRKGDGSPPHPSTAQAGTEFGTSGQQAAKKWYEFWK